MREFKDSISGVESAFDLEQENEETKAALAQDAPMVAPEATPVAAATPQHAEPPPAPVTVPVEQAPSGTEQSS